MRYATFPLDCEANRKANEAAWKKHPEMKGKKLTMGPQHAQARKDWMDAYIAAGGKHQPTQPKLKAGDPITTCPVGKEDPKPPKPTPATKKLTSNLVVQVKDDRGIPAEGIKVDIAGPEKRSGVTDKQGTARFNGVQRGTYKVTAAKNAFVKAEGDAAVTKEGQGLDADNWAELKLPKTKRAPIQWLQQTKEIHTPIFGGGPGSGKVTKTNTCVIEKFQEVPHNWIMGTWNHQELERTPAALGSGVTYVRRYWATYVAPSLTGHAKKVILDAPGVGGNDTVYDSWDKVPASQSTLNKHRP